MKVSLLSYTRNARELLVFTKNTRLEMTAGGIADVFRLTDEEIQRELDYMVNTIKSSWEFVDFTFSIEGVSRGFTHQFVRNRLGSYAQQTMRILDVSDFTYVTGPSIANDSNLHREYSETMEVIRRSYQKLIDMGAKIEDARGILPTNIATNIVAKFNLRALSNMMSSRASSRTQSEYREVLDAMHEAVISAEPWLDQFLRNGKYHALGQLESIIRDQFEGTSKLVPYIKLIDKVRNG